MGIAALGELGCLTALIDGFSATTYFTAVVLFQTFWCTWLPIQMANIAAADKSGRFTVVIGLFQAIGIAVGPMLAAKYLTGNSFLPVYITAAVFVILTLLLFAPIALKGKSIERYVD